MLLSFAACRKPGDQQANASPKPTEAVTEQPTEEPTKAPTEAPTEAPTPEPTLKPIEEFPLPDEPEGPQVPQA